MPFTYSDLRRYTENENRPGQFLVHPPVDQRIKRLESAIRRLQPLDRYIVTTQEFDEVRSRLGF